MFPTPCFFRDAIGPVLLATFRPSGLPCLASITPTCIDNLFILNVRCGKIQQNRIGMTKDPIGIIIRSFRSLSDFFETIHIALSCAGMRECITRAWRDRIERQLVIHHRGRVHLVVAHVLRGIDLGVHSTWLLQMRCHEGRCDKRRIHCCSRIVDTHRLSDTHRLDYSVHLW